MVSSYPRLYWLGLAIFIGIGICLLLPSGAFTLYPWWLPIIMFCLFFYRYGVYYFFVENNIRKLSIILRAGLYLADILLFIPATFLIFVVFVKMGVYDVPILFERKALCPEQMLVVSNQLYTVFSQERKLETSSQNNLQRDFDSLKNTLLFQVRLAKRNLLTESFLFQELSILEKKIPIWEYPQKIDSKEKMIQELEKSIQPIEASFALIADKKILWNLTKLKKSLNQTLEQFRNLTILSPASSAFILPIPQLYWLSPTKLLLFWREQEKNWMAQLDLTQVCQNRLLGEYHHLTLFPNLSQNTAIFFPYQFELHRYPRYGNTFMEEGVKHSATISFSMEEIPTISFVTRYRSFFHRLSLLGTVSGIRHQDIFFRMVLAFEKNYMQWSILAVMVALFFLGSLPVLQLSKRVPQKLWKWIQSIFGLIQHSTSIPIYAIISILFIGVYDGKNFTILFLCVGYFLLPSFYSEMNFQVIQYRQTYLLAKQGLGFSDKTIFWHFIFRESISLYLVYGLYFCATMILFETSFAYLKGGSPSELSLGIFLHLSQNNWTTETYASVYTLIATIYFFCRQASYFGSKESTAP